MCLSFSDHHMMLLPQGGPQMNKFEQVSSNQHQMSLAEGIQVWCPGRVPYHVTYPMMHLMSPNTCQQTDSCENITFQQLLLQAVITICIVEKEVRNYREFSVLSSFRKRK